MAFPRRIFRILWVSVGLLILGLPAVTFLLARAAEYTLRSERQVGEWSFKFSGTRITPFLALRADSARFESPDTRIFVSSPSISLLDWVHFWTRQSLVRARVDSAEFRISEKKDAAAETPTFPELRFPLPISLEWKVLDIRPADGAVIRLSRAHWNSQGPWGLIGTFHGRWESNSGGDYNGSDYVAEADFVVHAKWFGRSVRYDLRAARNRDTLRILGLRTKKVLAVGEDSLTARISDVQAWLPDSVANLPDLRDLRLRGKIDWRNEKLFLAGEIRTGAFHVLQPSAWSWTLRGDSISGNLDLRGEGVQDQSIRLQGQWRHPSEWLVKPDWNSYAARFSGRVQGVRWQIDEHRLPLDFAFSSLQLAPGLEVQGDIVTSDSSRLELRWNGNHPQRFDVSGPISPRETWALIWTDTNVSFQKARVKGTWDKDHFQGTAWLQGVSAYGSQWDSLEATQEVLPTGYYLKDSKLFHEGQTFRGSGHVEWEHAGRPALSMAFKLSHPQFGALKFAMPHEDSMDAWIENAHVARFPYKPLKPYARFNPQVNGSFSWNFLTGVGHSDANLVFSHQSKELKAHATASWDRDSLRLASVEAAQGASEFKGQAVVSLGKKSLDGLAHLNPDAVGSLQAEITRLRAGEIFEWLPNAKIPADGILDGKIGYDRSSGWSGNLRASEVRVPALRGLTDVTSVSVSGRGDTLLVSLRTASTRNPLLSDTIEARLFGLRSGHRLEVSARSGLLHAEFKGGLPGWKSLQGNVEVTGGASLGSAGSLDQGVLRGDLYVPFAPGPDSGARFNSRQFQLRYVSALDTQWLDGQLHYSRDLLTSSDLRIHHSQGGDAKVRLEAHLAEPVSARADFSGTELRLVFSGGRQVVTRGVTGSLRWEKGKALQVNAEAASGSFRMGEAPLRVDGNMEGLLLQASLPDADSADLPKVKVRGRMKDFLFQRKLGFQDAQNFFRSFKSRKEKPSGSHRSKPWDLDLQIDAVGSNNRINTDVLRLSFLGDLQVKGIYPYTLLNGSISGLQGEIGQTSQAYDLRDFEVKWENSTVDEGTIYVEGDKKLRVDCKPATHRTCSIFVKLNGRLSEMNFNYDTDCGQNLGEPASPAVLINSATQGCYSSEFQSGGGRYGEAVINMLEPSLSENLTKGLKWASGGFIESTQLSGLGSLIGGDTASFEPVAVEVATREKYRVALKGKAGYHPERKLADPWEYRLAAEYRIPLDKLAVDSTFRARVKDRFTLETAVETRPPDVLSQEEGRQVRQQAGLRYHYRFWGWW